MSIALFATNMRTLGWSCPELAKRIGCSRFLVHWWISGKCPPPDEVARYVAECCRALQAVPRPQWEPMKRGPKGNNSRRPQKDLDA